jgi:hypothetical protein
MEQPEKSSLSAEEKIAMATSKRPTELDVYVKGTSFLRFTRRSLNDWKN